jgi:DNA-binding transcriptional ArsR family regulator
VHGDADVASVAALLAHPARARCLYLLLSQPAMTAGGLARAAGVSAASMSQHLRQLEAGGLLVVERRGRHRWYRLASAEVARALETLARIAQPLPVRSLRQAREGEALRYARTCYDHLAGRVGVGLARVLLEAGIVAVADGVWTLTDAGRDWCAGAGIDVDGLAQGRRPLLRPCQDWSERAPHLAGALGQAVLERLEALGWVVRVPGRRHVRIVGDAVVPPAWRHVLDHVLSASAAVPPPSASPSP